MGDTFIIYGLTTKWAELSGIIADLEKRAAQHRADLVHIDAVLRLYGEDEPEGIAPKAVRRRNDWFTEFHAGADERIQHPFGHHRNVAGRRLNGNETAVGA